MTNTVQALVIGGGIAGGAVAAQLARAGRDVVLLERRTGPHDKVCGEFISGEAALYLRDLGIDLAALGAVRISTVRLYAGNRMATARLPFPAFSLSRRVLDEAILRAAAAYGAEIRTGRSVRTLHHDAPGWVAVLEGGDRISAADAFLATGKHDLRGWKRPPGRHGDLVAFKLHWRLRAEQTAALASCVELFVFPGGYAGLERVENDIGNLCLVIRRGHLAQLEYRWDLLLSALRAEFFVLHERLSGATACWQRPLAISAIPYGFVQHSNDGRSDAPWRLGDQAAVIPSFSGGGMSIALHSAQLAARCYLSGNNAAHFQAQLASDLAARVRSATLMSRVLVHPAGQRIAIAAARWLPEMLGAVAHYTRIPSRCVSHARRPLKLASTLG